MEQAFPVSIGWMAALVAAILFEILFPLLLGFIVWRRFGVSWRYFLYGALIFFLFQLITRVPAVLVIQNLIQPQLQASQTLLFAWVVILSFTAGLFEEGGRYIGYRWLMQRETKTWSKGVMFGLGHGGLESMLFVGGLSILTLVNLVALSAINLQTLPEAQRNLVTQQLAQIAAQPVWLPLISAYERFWTIAIQVGLSVLVLQVFVRGSLRWLWLAILAHMLVDLIPTSLASFVKLPALQVQLLGEGVVTFCGLIALWVIWRLRDAPAVPAAQVPVLEPRISA